MPFMNHHFWSELLNNMPYRKNKTLKRFKTILEHLSFWVFSFFILLLIFKQPGGINTIDLIYTSIFFMSLVPMVYANIGFAVPRFLQKKKNLLFVLFSAILIIAASAFNHFLFNHLADFIFPGYYFVSYFSFSEIIIIHLIFLILTTLLAMSKDWFTLLESQRRIAVLEKDKKEAELDTLKGQVNPHFLFNTLNNLYSLAQKKSELTAEMILKLSDLMRYVLYDTTANFVELKQEIAFIENYINLQKLRTSKPGAVKFTCPTQLDQHKIAPLILIHFVENCFKHGLKGDTENAFVEIDLKVKNGKLDFISKNNVGVVDDIEKNKTGGKGLINAKKRLDLIYGEKYKLDMSADKNIYSVHLNIDLK
jgi:sensor histidine kinase YesM